MTGVKVAVSADIGVLQNQVGEVLERFKNIPATIKSEVTGGAVKGGIAGGAAAGATMKLIDLVAGIVTGLKPVTTMLQMLTNGLILTLMPAVMPLFRLMMPIFAMWYRLIRAQTDFYKNPEEAFKKAFTDMFDVNNETYDVIDKKIPLLDSAEIINALIRNPTTPAMWISKLFTSEKIDLGGWIKTKISDGLKGISNLGEWLSEKIDKVLSFDDEKLSAFGTWIFEGIEKIVAFADEKLSAFGTWIFEGIDKTIIFANEKLAKFGTWIFENIETTIDFGGDVWNDMKKLGQYLWAKIKLIIDDALANLSSRAGSIVDAAKSKIESIKSYFGGGDRETSGGDFVVTPQGQMIRTAPDDYIFATRHPESLMGGAGSGTKNETIINVNVYGVAPENIGEMIAQQIASEQNRFGM